MTDPDWEDETDEEGPEGVAVVGMSGRFPGAADLDAFWENLKAGQEAVRTFEDEELLAAGVSADEVAAPNYVKAGSILDDVEHFDAEFFGYTPREAQILDPQMRLFLECAWEAFENAGYDPAEDLGLVGVYAGMRISDYLLRNLYANPEILQSVGHFQAVLSNDKDYLAPLTSYKLNLRGPSLTVQSACSTSLAAIHLASEALNNRECDMALAGASTIRLPQVSGYHYHPAGIFSRDGHCRPFDASASGTVFGNGVGAVLLKRLGDALDAGDRVLAVVRGSAVNNDGSQKVGFTAPSVAGQTKVVADAHAMADIEPHELGYIECHGTGTNLGDPIEIRALRQVFEASDGVGGRCGLGSVKSNVGHLEVAAGLAGFVKTVESVRRGVRVPSLHFETENPELRLESTPFYVCTETEEWTSDEPRLAAVSSFGIGGTNAHIVLEEPPETPESSPSTRSAQLLVLSARSDAALDAARERLQRRLAEESADEPTDLADVAFTLQQGRRAFARREAWIAADVADAAESLANGRPTARGGLGDASPSPVFLFPGQGLQYAGMGAELYESEAVFREAVDEQAQILIPLLGFDIRSLLFPTPEHVESAHERLRQTANTQPALFVIEYAAARLWMSWGVRPAALLGHSLGEYVAACLAEVFSLRDALDLVVERGRLMQSMPEGAMLSVEASTDKLDPHLDESVEKASINSPELCSISGSSEAIDALQSRLEEAGISSRRLRTSHAYHSKSMEAAVLPFVERVRQARRGEPQIPVISNVTGEWLTPAQAADPEYWGSQLRQAVLFQRGVETVAELPGATFLEVGPGRSLGTFVGQTLRGRGAPPTVIGSMPRAKDREQISSAEETLRALGKLWVRGVDVDWKAFQGDEERRRVALPTYPFQRSRHWVEPKTAQTSPAIEAESAAEEQAPDSEDDLLSRLIAIWRDLLGYEEIGPDDDFFALGGHSLLATRLLARLQGELDVEVRLEDFFAHPTPAGLAELCAEGAPAQEPAVRLPPLVAAEEEDASPPLSAPQERLWFLQQLYPQSPAYNLPGVFVWEGSLDHDALSGAFGAIVRRHQTLRARFPAQDGRALQIIDPPAEKSTPMPQIDLRGLRVPDRARQAVRLGREEALRPFDLERGPLLRGFVMTLDDDEHHLALSLHHIIADGWSFSVLWRESRELYTAALERRAADLPPLAVQYGDYARWQRSWLDAPDGEDEARRTLTEWWREQLQGMPQVLDFPIDFPRPQVQGFRGFRVPFGLDEERSAALATLGREYGATLYMTLLAAFQVFLGQTTGAGRFLIGTNVANRNRTELEALIGLFVNQVVLRGDLSGRSSFAELIERTKKTALESFARQELPLERLLDALEVKRDLSRNALFQVMFVVQNLPVALPAAETPTDEVEEVSVRHDLRLEVLATSPRIHGVFEARGELFAVETIRRWTERFENLLDAILDAPQTVIESLPRFTEAEERELLVERQGEARDEPTATIDAAFRTQAAKTPDAIVLAEGARQWSYAATARRVGGLATSLREQGVGPEIRVAIAMPRGVDAMIAVLAVLEAGGAYVPIDPKWPRERREYVMGDSGAVLVLEALHQSGPSDPAMNRRAIAEGAPPGLPESPLSGGAFGCSLGIHAQDSAPQTAAYVLYTSGSTGRPKGVVVEHRQVLSYVAGVRERLDLPAATFALAQPLTVDSSKTTVFPSLLSGGRLEIFNEADSLDASALRRAFVARTPDVLKIAPSHYGALLTVADPLTLLPRQRLIVGGEASKPRWAHRLARASRGRANVCRVFNHYGPTETTVGVLTFGVSGDDPDAASLPTGRPLPGVRAFVVDADMRSTPSGVPGELLIGGLYTARGYQDRPATTAAAYVPDPFSGEAGARLYRTGDVFRWNLDAQLEFLGRRDHQVKIRGFRVELGEIENAALEHADVAQALVQARAGRLVGWFAVGEAAIGEAELRTFLRGKLPEHMTPSAIAVLPELPRMAHGKLDLKALPTPEASAKAEGRAPSTKQEIALARIWQEVLGRDEVGVDENFFDVGGDSILSIQVAARAGQEGMRLSVQQIFEHQTISALARIAANASQIEIIAEQGEIVGPAPLTPIQRRFFAQRRVESNWFNQSSMLRPQTDLDPAALDAAVAVLLRRHDALRLRFVCEDGIWTQEHASFDRGATPRIPRIDLSGLDREAAEGAWKKAADRLQASLDLKNGPLLRLGHGVLGGESERLLFIVHHLAIDGVSWRVLIEDLETAYSAFVRGEVPQMPAKTSAFRDWATHLARAEQAVAPPAGEFGREGTLIRREIVLDAERTEQALGEAHRPYRTRLDDLLLTAVALTLVDEDFASVIEFEGHGRDPGDAPYDLSRTVGWLSTAEARRFDASHDDPGAAVLAVKSALREPPTDESAEVLYNNLGRLDVDLPDLPDLHFGRGEGDVGAQRSPRQARAHRYEVLVAIAGGRLRLEWIASRDYADAATLERLAERCGVVLDELIEHCLHAEPAAASTTIERRPYVEPSDAFEREVGRLFEEILEIDRVGANDDFFTLGAGAYHARRLRERARERFARELPEDILEAGASVARLARFLQPWEGDLGGFALVPLQPQGRSAPFFCIHPAGGTILSFLNLAREMGEKRPFFAVQDPAFFDPSRRFPSVEAMASAYLDEIRPVAMRGPFHLCGHSFGGVVAYEMAHQLRVAGFDDVRATLLDVPAPRGTTPPDDAHALAHLVGVLCVSQGFDRPLVADDLAPLPREERLARALEALEILPAEGRIDAEHLLAFFELYKDHLKILQAYRPPSYDGEILLIRAREIAATELQDESVRDDPSMGWSEHAARVAVREVSGNHTTMLSPPHATALAALLHEGHPDDPKRG